MVVVVISHELPSKEGHAKFTAEPLKPQSDHLCGKNYLLLKFLQFTPLFP